MAMSTAVLSTAAPRDYQTRVFMEQGGDSLRGTSSGRIMMGDSSLAFVKITAMGTLNVTSGAISVSSGSTMTHKGTLTVTTLGTLLQKNIHHSSSDGITVAANANLVIVDTTKITTFPRPSKGKVIDFLVQSTVMGKTHALKATSSKIFINSSGQKANGVNVTMTSSQLMDAPNGGIGCHVMFVGYSTTLYYAVGGFNADFWKVAPTTMAGLI